MGHPANHLGFLIILASVLNLSSCLVVRRLLFKQPKGYLVLSTKSLILRKAYLPCSHRRQLLPWYHLTAYLDHQKPSLENVLH